MARKSKPITQPANVHSEPSELKGICRRYISDYWDAVAWIPGLAKPGYVPKSIKKAAKSPKSKRDVANETIAYYGRFKAIYGCGRLINPDYMIQGSC